MQKKILIVDDQKDVLKVLDKRLSGAGYAVIKAENGKEALLLAKAEHPDLIVLDIIMPEMDGAETAAILKNDAQTKDIPVIFLTCLFTEKDEKEGHVVGGKYFIAKPYNPDELLEIVNTFLK